MCSSSLSIPLTARRVPSSSLIRLFKVWRWWRKTSQTLDFHRVILFPYSSQSRPHSLPYIQKLIFWIVENLDISLNRAHRVTLERTILRIDTAIEWNMNDFDSNMGTKLHEENWVLVKFFSTTLQTLKSLIILLGGTRRVVRSIDKPLGYVNARILIREVKFPTTLLT